MKNVAREMTDRDKTEQARLRIERDARRAAVAEQDANSEESSATPDAGQGRASGEEDSR